MPKGFGKIIAKNKKAFHDFFIEETFEAGLVLKGSEIKSIRLGKANIKDAYAQVDRNEISIYNMHITPYDFGTKENHEPTRVRRLLLHRREIKRLIGLQQQQGYSLIPLKLYLKDGYAKIEIALAKGKRQYDKRETLKKKDSNRQFEKAMRDRERL